jgi:mono/diheme cytochrome c family protein
MSALELGSGADDRARAGAEPQVAPPTVGVRVYAALCASCHGDDGRGDTPLGADLDPPPNDLTRCNFKLRSTESGTLPARDDLLRTLYVGIPGSAMPSFGEVMPVPVLRALVREVSRRCDRLAREPAGAALAVLDAPGAADASVERGRRVYGREGCASCHGDAGDGDGPAAGNLRDAQGRRISPRDYTRGVFRSGFTAGDVYRAFSTGLDGTPMPAVPEEVSARDRWDLTRYILSLSARRRLWRAVSQPPTWYEPALGRRRPWAGK